jgi:hypothetical protein
MQTIKQIERLWTTRRYESLLKELVAYRPDAEFVNRLQAGPLAPAASAMAMIRLDELGQAGAPIYHKFLLAVLSSQESDGGWGDPILSALCLRALLGTHGGGQSIERGLAHLASLQKDDGAWPRIPVRRTPADALTSAVVLYQLGHEPRFRAAVRFDRAVDWLQNQTSVLDPLSRKIWLSVRMRCALTRPPR